MSWTRVHFPPFFLFSFSFFWAECHCGDGFIALDPVQRAGRRSHGTTDERGRKLADGSIHFTAN